MRRCGRKDVAGKESESRMVGRGTSDGRTVEDGRKLEKTAGRRIARDVTHDS